MDKNELKAQSILDIISLLDSDFIEKIKELIKSVKVENDKIVISFEITIKK